MGMKAIRKNNISIDVVDFLLRNTNIMKTMGNKWVNMDKSVPFYAGRVGNIGRKAFRPLFFWGSCNIMEMNGTTIKDGRPFPDNRPSFRICGRNFSPDSSSDSMKAE